MVEQRSVAGLTRRRATARRSDSRSCGERAGGSGCASRRCISAMAAADRLAAIVPARAPARASTVASWRLRRHPGARRAARCLRGALASLDVALAAIDEPRQVIVVANGAPRAVVRRRARALSRRRMGARRRAARLRRRDRARARARALRRHVPPEQRHDARSAARSPSCCRSRAPDVFAIASQIFQQERSRPPRGNGIHRLVRRRGGVHLYHAPAPASPEPLRAPLRERRRRAVPHRAAAPLRAGEPLLRSVLLGGRRVERARLARRHRVLFCPALARRAPASRDDGALLFAATSSTASSSATAAVRRAPRRIGGFGARGCWSASATCRMRASASSRASARRRACFASGWRARVAAALRRRPGSPDRRRGRHAATRRTATDCAQRRRSADAAASARRHAVRRVSAAPRRRAPRRRIGARALRSDFDIALVTDEASLYDARSFADFDGLCDVHLVQRREPAAGGNARRCASGCDALPSGARRGGRGRAASTSGPTSSRSSMRSSRRLCGYRTPGHALDPRPARRVRPRRFRGARGRRGGSRTTLRAYDAVTVCSDEDGALLAHPRVVCVPNGSAVGVRRLSAVRFDAAAVRRAVSLRAEPRGHRALPARRVARDPRGGARGDAAHPGRRRACAIGPPANPRSRSRASTVLGHRDDVPRAARACALTINPLARHPRLGGQAGRVARRRPRVRHHRRRRARLRDRRRPGLVIVPDVAAMAGADRRRCCAIRSAARARSARARRAGRFRVATLRGTAAALYADAARADSQARPLTGTYDRIARFYDVDMAQNMRFDDVALLRADCASRSAGRVLELGCGNGRILLRCSRGGHRRDRRRRVRADARRAARARRRCGSLPARAIRDGRRAVSRCGPGSPRCCARIRSSPTSPTDDDVARASARVRGAARARRHCSSSMRSFRGRSIAQAEFTPDYRRPFGALHARALEAHHAAPGPRPTASSAATRCSRGDGHVVETSRGGRDDPPVAPDALRAAFARRGIRTRSRNAWDYGTRPAPRRRAVLHAVREAGSRDRIDAREPATRIIGRNCRRTPHESAARCPH